MGLSDLIKTAYRALPETSRAMLDGTGEHALWIRQLRGQRASGSDNAMGIDPEGMTWKTETHVIEVQRQGLDQMDRHVMYVQVEPAVGDRIVTLVGDPGPSEARGARHAGVFRVENTDARRDPDGRLIYTKLKCAPDRSGQW